MFSVNNTLYFAFKRRIRSKKKRYRLNTESLGMLEITTLIEYYFKVKVKNADEYAEYYQKLVWLGHMEVIDKRIK